MDGKEENILTQGGIPGKREREEMAKERRRVDGVLTKEEIAYVQSMASVAPGAFGLAQVKQEGYIFQYDGNITCDGLGSELSEKLRATNLPWYFRFLPIDIEKILEDFWFSALIAGETSRNKDG